MNICFSKNHHFEDIKVEDTPIETVQSAKLVGVHIQNDLKWNTHIDSIVKKSHARIHFLSQLKRARAAEKDMMKFYLSIVRPVLEYACPAWSTALPQYLSEKIESVQKRSMTITHPDLTYSQALEKAKLPPYMTEGRFYDNRSLNNSKILRISSIVYSLYFESPSVTIP